MISLVLASHTTKKRLLVLLQILDIRESPFPVNCFSPFLSCLFYTRNPNPLFLPFSFTISSPFFFLRAMTYNKGNNPQMITGNSACTYRFIPSSLSDLPSERYSLLLPANHVTIQMEAHPVYTRNREYDIILRQQPERAKMSVPNERGTQHIKLCCPENTKIYP